MISINPDILDVVSKDELWMLLHMAREIGIKGKSNPKNEELKNITGFGLNKVKEVRSSLEKEQLMVRREHRGQANDYRIITNLVSVNIPLHEVQRRNEAQPVREEVEEVTGADEYLAKLLDDQEWIKTASMNIKIPVKQIVAKVKSFTADKKLLQEDKWPTFKEYRKHFFNWLRIDVVNNRGKSNFNNPSTPFVYDRKVSQITSPEAKGLLKKINS